MHANAAPLDGNADDCEVAPPHHQDAHADDEDHGRGDADAPAPDVHAEVQRYPAAARTG